MKRTGRFVLLPVVCMCFLSCSARDSEKKIEASAKPIPAVEVMAKVDKTTATTSDSITYTVVVNSDPGVKVEIPEPGSQIAGLRIVDFGEEGPKIIDNRRIIKKWYILQGDLAGTYIIPSITVSYRDRDNSKKQVKTAQIFIEIKSALNNEKDRQMQDIIDIKPLQEIRRDISPFIITGLLAVLIALVAIFTAVYLKKRKARYRKVVKPPHILAFEELEALKKNQLVEKGVVREYYFRLSEIFRRYVERRFNVPAVERTTEEVLPEIMQIKDCDTNVKAKARDFLRQADLVKFARHTPEEHDINRGYDQVVEIIDKTKQESMPSENSSTTEIR